MPETYGPLIREFYANFWFGVLTLVLPTLATAALVALLFGVLAKVAGARLHWLLVFSFIFAFALVGSVSGVVAGWTLEGIVGAVLAAVLGMVSSLLTYLFGKQTLRVWRPVIPLAIGALLATTLVGLVLGGSRRSQVMNTKAAFTRADTDYERIYVPVEVQRRNALMKKCMDERPKFAEAVNCEQPPPL